MKKSGVARPWQKFKKWVIKQEKVKIKKPGQPSLGNSYNHLLSTMMTIMTGSAIKSTVTGGEVSLSQRSLVSHVGQRLKHHVHSKQKGWVSQGAKTKPIVLVQARVDQPAYMALQITPPSGVTRVSEGHHLADTGASICLGGKQFMRSLGLNEAGLTPCDMSVCGADSANIQVLGAVLVEFALKSTAMRSKQVVYICEGVAGGLLSLEACIDLGLVSEQFPNQSANEGCYAAGQAKKENCECKCPVRAEAPDVPDSLPFEPSSANVSKLDTWIREYYSASAFNCCECQPLTRMHNAWFTPKDSHAGGGDSCG